MLNAEDDKKNQNLRLAALRRKVKDISSTSQKPGTARLVHIFTGTALLLLLLVLISWYQENGGFSEPTESLAGEQVAGKKVKGKKAFDAEGRRGGKRTRKAKREDKGGKASKMGKNATHAAIPRIRLPPGETCVLTHSRMAYTFDRLEKAVVTKAPFPHLYVKNVFEPDFYQCLLAHLPVDTAKDTKAVYRKKKSTGRYTLPLPSKHIPSGGEGTDAVAWEALDKTVFNATFWQGFSEKITDVTMRDILLAKFADIISKRGGSVSIQETSMTLELQRDRKGFTMGPHTDVPERLVAAHFYLPRNMDHSKMGTTLVESASGQTQSDNKRQSWSDHDFVKVKQMEFIPNAMFAFAPCLSSWHAVPEWILPKGSRDTIVGVVASDSKDSGKLGSKGMC